MATCWVYWLQRMEWYCLEQLIKSSCQLCPTWSWLVGWLTQGHQLHRPLWAWESLFPVHCMPFDTLSLAHQHACKFQLAQSNESEPKNFTWGTAMAGLAPGRTDVQLCGVPVCVLCEVLCIVYLLCMEYLAQYTASCIFTSLDTTGEPSTSPVANSNTVYEPLYVFFTDTQIGYSKLFWPTLFINTTLILHTTSVYFIQLAYIYIYIYI